MKGEGLFPGPFAQADVEVVAPVATLLGAWRDRVCTRAGWAGVSELWVGEIASLIFDFYLICGSMHNCLGISVRETH